MQAECLFGDIKMPLKDGQDTPKRKQGRPAHAPTPELRQRVEGYVSCGVTHEQIRKLLNISRPSLEKHYRTELDLGAAVANGRIAGKLYEKALSGDSACMFFWLKTRARWQEVPRYEHAGGPDKPIALKISWEGE